MQTEVIKVITGIRRCGKSVMLELVHQELVASGIPQKWVLFMNCETATQKSPVRLINSLLIDFSCDIYLTGSNAHLLSGELTTFSVSISA